MPDVRFRNYTRIELEMPLRRNGPRGLGRVLSILQALFAQALIDEPECLTGCCYAPRR
jgi:hypothetical protein